MQIPPEKLKLLNQMVYSDSQKVIGRSLRVCECDLTKTVKRIQKKYQVEVEGYTLQKTKLLIVGQFCPWLEKLFKVLFYLKEYKNEKQ